MGAPREPISIDSVYIARGVTPYAFDRGRCCELVEPRKRKNLGGFYRRFHVVGRRTSEFPVKAAVEVERDAFRSVVEDSRRVSIS